MVVVEFGFFGCGRADAKVSKIHDGSLDGNCAASRIAQCGASGLLANLHSAKSTYGGAASFPVATPVGLSRLDPACAGQERLPSQKLQGSKGTTSMLH